MPEYKVTVSNTMSVIIVADSKEEAEEKALNGGFCPHEFADGAEVDDVEEIQSEGSADD